MIVFDLQCGNGHVFEGWFASSEAFADQKARDLVRCPSCDTRQVQKAVMAPRIATKDVPDDIEGMRQRLSELAVMQKRLLERSEHVGERFADEARAIHLGEAEARSIWGTADSRQADALADEGIKVARLPFPAIPPKDQN